jgi:hypothetical protein
MTDHSRQLQRETEAARILRAQLAALVGDDEEAVRDTIEGETSLHELIGSVVEEIAADCASIEGIDAHMKTMRGRKERLEARVESRRSAILNAMAVGEIKKLELAIATLSRKPVPSKALVLDEALIPAQFWKRADPTLDKRALLDALKGEQIVPGAALSNGGEAIAIKWS